ncbi:MAG: rhodanese-related sulfurtransferase [Chlamydiae bacterium]|nr:rhodanese-related sulfurtransferase [Chlamydiota bacterium]
MDSDQQKYCVLAFYLFIEIEDPHKEVAKHKEFFQSREITSRIYISHQGINAQMSGTKKAIQEYMDWMQEDPRFVNIDFKIHAHHEQAFPRATVKYRKQLVALDHNADPHRGGEHVRPAQWKQMLQEDTQNTLLLDVRNDYEWKIGHFEGAVRPELDMFRRFPEYVKQLREQYDPEKTRVMMYCTGGIRCELYSALMKEVGFTNVYQLQGGVIRYGLEEGTDLWKGKLFVFDDRLAVPLSEEAKEPISQCHRCGTPCDVYYNCANMDCNALFLSCAECARAVSGCCSSTCLEAPRVRPFAENPKPFRRKHLCTEC